MPPLNNAKILIVDADESIRYTFERFLGRAGYAHVEAVATAAGALAAIKNASYDLVISDILLDDISGPEFLKQLRDNGVECPVVVITGAPDIDSATEMIRLGVFDYIHKPINKNVLLRFTNLALRHRILQNEKNKLLVENEKYRRYLKAVFRSVRDAVITVDRNMSIIELNDTAREWIVEYPDNPASIPSSLTELHGEFVTSCLVDAEQVVEMTKDVVAHRVEYVIPGKKNMLISLNASPIVDDADQFYGVVLVGRDITSNVLTDEPAISNSFHGFVDNSPAMLEVFRLIKNVGTVDSTVLVTGESGTGKELTAEALHFESPRNNGPLVKVDCASIPEELLESELFGHIKGAFTGADRDRTGRILQADGGTLFLDEIGDITSRLQLRLLRFLQERTFYPVGQDKPVKVNVRVVAATNANLQEKVNNGTFREDLFYRLRVVEINLPPLRARQPSIPLLVQHFITIFSKKIDRVIDGISDQALGVLISYPWPGNVRELRHAIERACVLCHDGTLTLDCLPAEIKNFTSYHSLSVPSDPLPPNHFSISHRNHSTHQVPSQSIPSSPTSRDQKIQDVIDALRQAENNKAKAARILGINRSTLYRRMRRWNISDVAI